MLASTCPPESPAASPSLPGGGSASPAEPRPITLLQPGRILFGNGCASTFVEDLKARGIQHAFIVTSSAVLTAASDVFRQLELAGIRCTIYNAINTEPDARMLHACLAAAHAAKPDAVIGLGGGSPMDVAKLVAALADGGQKLDEIYGINLLRGRKLFLACLPTTSGTGSEVSPNAIILDEASQLKRGVISPHLVPDVACVDPLLTLTVPAAVTAATGLDALTHCIEAYANRFAHPLADLFALQGVRLIGANLITAVHNGNDRAARSAMALGSLYGGLCLGPVNTAAVHALAYPLGSEFHVAHGISNSVLLPHVLRFNLPAAVERYADIALALGVVPGATAQATAARGIERLVELAAACPIPQHISELGVPREALPRLAQSAMTVTRLLKNNPRPLTEGDALAIYTSAW
jgi:alcohol dehydrogenase class IV